MSRPATLREVESPRQPEENMANGNGGKRNGAKVVAVTIVLTAAGTLLSTGFVQWGFSSTEDVAAAITAQGKSFEKSLKEARDETTGVLKEINDKLAAQGEEFAEFSGAYKQNEKHVDSELARLQAKHESYNDWIDVFGNKLAELKAKVEAMERSRE